MDPISAILGALLAGATAAASTTANRAVKDAYEGLKKVLIDGYHFASTSLLEKSPEDPSYREAVKRELNTNPAIAKDKKVVEKTGTLQDALAALPQAELSKLKIELKDIEVGRDAILTQVNSLTAENVKTGRDFIVSGGDSTPRK
ncbi:hypothetical protein ACVIRO_007632 [Rhizobium ruizarguesonis]